MKVSIPKFTLENKVAIITGAKRGIGRATALLFAEAGADIIIASRFARDESNSLEAVAEEIRKLGRRCLPVQADVSKRADVDNMIETTVRQFGGLDILVNCAAISLRNTPMDVSEEDWDNTLDINLKGFLFCAQAAGKQMLAQKRGGSIITIASVAAYTSPLIRAAYASSKLAAIMLVRQLAKEISIHNIRVNAITAGFTRTEMTKDLWGDPEALEKELNTIPMHRWAEPSEIAAVALMLASEAASYITGASIAVDGGMTA